MDSRSAQPQVNAGNPGPIWDIRGRLAELGFEMDWQPTEREAVAIRDAIAPVALVDALWAEAEFRACVRELRASSACAAAIRTRADGGRPEPVALGELPRPWTRQEREAWIAATEFPPLPGTAEWAAFKKREERAERRRRRAKRGVPPDSVSDCALWIRAIAAPYAGQHKLGLEVVVTLLCVAASEPDDRRAYGRLITRVSATPVFDTYQPGDSQRALRSDLLDRIARGARLVARRGAGRCGGCGVVLIDQRPMSARDRRYRRAYCSPCESTAESWKDEPAVQAVLDAAAAQVLREPSRERARRAARLPRA